MRGKKRPSSERAKAVGIALVDGATVASEATGIPRPTIIGWRDSPEFDELRQRTREVATNELWAFVQKGFRRVGELLDSADDVQKTATATAIIADKMLLLRGEATSRYESRDVTSDLDDHERGLLNDAIRGELARRTDSPAEGDAVGVPAATGADPTAG